MLLLRPRTRRVWGLDLTTVGLGVMAALVAVATGSGYAYAVAALLAAAALDSAVLVRRTDQQVVIWRLFRRTRRLPVGTCSFGWRRERFGRAALAMRVYVRDATTVVDIESFSVLRPARVARMPHQLAATLLPDLTS